MRFDLSTLIHQQNQKFSPCNTQKNVTFTPWKTSNCYNLGYILFRSPNNSLCFEMAQTP